MTSRPIPHAISAAELTEDNNAVRRRLLDGLADAANRAPRLVTTPAQETIAEPSVETPQSAAKRGRAAAASRAKPAKAKSARTGRAKEAPKEPLEAPAAMDVKTPEIVAEPEAAGGPAESPPEPIAPTVHGVVFANLLVELDHLAVRQRDPPIHAAGELHVVGGDQH